MAGVLVKPLVALGPGELARVGRDEVRVVYGEVVKQPGAVEGAEAFDDAEPLARHAGRSEEIRGLDEERVALPPADGITPEGHHVRREVLGVDADDARPVHPLDHDQNVVFGLNDGFHVVVDGRPNRHCYLAEIQAAGAQRLPFRIVVRVAALGEPKGFAGVFARPRQPRPGGPRFAGIRGRRLLSVGRIDQNRGRVFAVDLE